MRLANRVVVVSVFLAAACFGSGLEQMERSFNGRMVEYDALIAKAQPPLRDQLVEQKSGFLAEYSKLPQGSAREAPLGALNQRSRAALEEGQRHLDAQLGATKAVADRELGAYRQQFVGMWKGVGMDLTITQDGGVQYKRIGPMTRELNAPITDFQRDHFKVGLLGITTTFRIDQPPHVDGGSWKMRIDGVDLVRVMPPGV